MGFALAVLYLVTTYLGTDTVFGPLDAYHVELIIAALVFLVSLPSLPGSFTLKTPQALSLMGLAAAVFMSVLMTGWAGGAVQAFQDFIPNPFAYFLVGLHCNSKRKVKFIVLLLLFVCLFVIAHGLIELRTLPKNTANLPHHYSTEYLLGDTNEAGQLYFRLRGQNLINDPNDFGQLIVSVIPLTFIFWRPKKLMRNTLYVLLPVSVLAYGAFLTHSRGCLLALLAIGVVAGRRRLGTIRSLVVAGGLYLAASKLGFTGGRGLESGEGRMVLWAESIGALKSHPLFGVGFGGLADYLGLTAHNSIMVCAAELGMFGLFFWSMFLFTTLRDTIALSSPNQITEAEPVTSSEDLLGPRRKTKENIDKAELNRLGELILLSLTGFLTAGFFLSRAFVLTLFLLGGIGEVIYEWALQRGMTSPRLKLSRVLRSSAILSASLLVGVYILLRISL
jgi:hypothetical protein